MRARVLDLAELKRLAKAATQRPWRIGFADGTGAGEEGEGVWITRKRPGADHVVRGGKDDWCVPFGVISRADADLICALVNSAPELLRLAAIGQAAERTQLDELEIFRSSVLAAVRGAR